MMTVEIWSDVMCPFCYIGKRRFEAALAKYEHRDQVQIVWRSFQLDPSLETDPEKSVSQSLAEKKGWTLAQTTQRMQHVVDMAQTVGLTFNFDRAVVANSFDAHRFAHFAKAHGKQHEAEEQLFEAYFVAGQNTASHETLAEMGASIGLDPADILTMLKRDDYAKDVLEDIQEARQLGISGVPFFVFNRQYAISGAQDERLFLETLQQADQPN